MRESKDSEERKDEFIDAAEKLFKENGIVDTTVNAIVKEMDVAKGLFYYYFKSKDDVIDAISEKYNTDFKESIRKSMNQDDFDSRLDQFIENSIVLEGAVIGENVHVKRVVVDKSAQISKVKELVAEENKVLYVKRQDRV